MDAYLSTKKKPLVKKLPFHDESQARDSKYLEQSGGGGGGFSERKFQVKFILKFHKVSREIYSQIS